MIRLKVIAALSLGLALTIGSCGKSQAKYGEAIPSDIKVVKLEEILDNPSIYDKKEVVLEGNFGGACCSADFIYKEGIEATEIYPQGFPTPKLDRGKPIRIYGVVKSIEKKTESEEEENERGGHEVSIQAKGVEVK